MLPENSNIEATLYFKCVPTSTTIMAVNRLRKRGTKTNAKGIKILKFSSNVRELEIHEMPLK